MGWMRKGYADGAARVIRRVAYGRGLTGGYVRVDAAANWPDLA